MAGTPHNLDAFVEAAGRFIDRKNLIAPKSGIVAAVSGGADSVAMLAAMRELAAESGRAYRLTVAHLNHTLRDGSDADAEFVAGLAERFSLPCIIERCDVAGESQRTGQGIEQAARMLRYKFLREAAERVKASYVATGHHADDNVETILFRIVRGTHLRGLAGMPVSRRLGDSDVLLVRPLLECRRSELQAYCLRLGLNWRTDPTNADTGYRRNFIRHKLLPTLRDRLNPRTDEALIRLAAAAKQADGFVSELADKLLAEATRRQGENRIVLEAAVLAEGAPLLRQYAMRSALERLGAALRMIGADRLAELADLAEAEGSSAVTLPAGFIARRDGEEVIIESAGRQHSPLPEAVIAINCPGSSSLADGREVSCRIEPLDRAAFESHCRNHPSGVEMLDADLVSGQLICRPRRDGDAFVPLGAPGRQTVSDFLTNLKLPPQQRERVRCICDEIGVVYFAPLRIDDRVKVRPSTRRVLHIKFSDA
ncbi:MAG: tRNA lysidine(34) synthetase TilS [Planctomycetota bacterium]|nr:tRNA lysidine(34) synthetase TilS [Planctomycetota bacterium]